MVSNDDVLIQAQRTSLQNIKQDISSGTAQYTKEWTVPSNKTWDLKRVIGERVAGTNLIYLYIKDTDLNVMIFAESGTSFQEYEPAQEFIIPDGWKIGVSFESDVSTLRSASLIVDELNSY